MTKVTLTDTEKTVTIRTPAGPITGLRRFKVQIAGVRGTIYANMDTAYYLRYSKLGDLLRMNADQERNQINNARTDNAFSHLNWTRWIGV